MIPAGAIVTCMPESSGAALSARSKATLATISVICRLVAGTLGPRARTIGST